LNFDYRPAMPHNVQQLQVRTSSLSTLQIKKIDVKNCIATTSPAIVFIVVVSGRALYKAQMSDDTLACSPHVLEMFQ